MRPRDEVLQYIQNNTNARIDEIRNELRHISGTHISQALRQLRESGAITAEQSVDENGRPQVRYTATS